MGWVLHLCNLFRFDIYLLPPLPLNISAMKVLVIGSGGREHALVWKLRQSPRITKVFCAPGNGGISQEAECVSVDAKSVESLAALANQLKPDLTVVGPELPLQMGVVDEFTRRGWPVFGPTKPRRNSKPAKALPSSSCSGTASRLRTMRSAIRLRRSSTSFLVLALP